MVATDHLKKKDKRLGKVIEQVGPFPEELLPYRTAFEALSRSITYQQLSGKAAATIHQRFLDAFGDGEYPDPVKVSKAGPEQLRSVGLSKSKASYIQGLATAQVSSDLPTLKQLQKMDDQAVIQALTHFKGVGIWTVQMLLMFWLGRQDVLPVADLGIQKGFQHIYGGDELPSQNEIKEYGERWRPYRTVASWYLWRVLEL